MSLSTKRMLCAAIGLLFALGLCRAARFRYQDREDAIRTAAAAQLTGLGITRDAAKAKYPTPEIAMVTALCLGPGDTGEVVVRGKFAPGTQFVFENDNLEVVKENLVGGEYRATLKAAVGVGPQSAALKAFSPVTNIMAYHDGAAAIGGIFEWNMDAANSWKVVARPQAGNACSLESGGQPYDMSFFKTGETNPFEKRNATLYYNAFDREGYAFTISQEDPNQGGMAGYMAMMKKIGDPSLTPAQREAAMKDIEKMQGQLTAAMEKMSSPAGIAEAQQKAAEFGCERISLEMQTGALKGTMRCADKVGRQIAVTGSMKFLGK
jgi:hypothetical protein